MRPLSLLLAVVYLFAVIGAPAGAAGAAPAEVKIVVNQPRIQRTGRGTSTTAEENQGLFQGDRVRTGASDRVGIVYDDGSQIKLDVNSSMVVDGTRTGPLSWRLARLVRGRLWARVDPPRGGAVELQAGAVTVTVRGTDIQLTVDEEDSVVLLVLSGAADMEAEGESVVVQEGQQCRAAAGQPPGEPEPGDTDEAAWADFTSRPAQPVTSEAGGGGGMGSGVLGLAALGLLLALAGGGGGGDMYKAPDLYSAYSSADAILQQTRELQSVFVALPHDGAAGTQMVGLDGGSISAGLGLMASQPSGAAGTCLYGHGRWELGRGSSDPALRLGLAFTSSADGKERGDIAYAGLDFPVGVSGNLSLELREWHDDGIGDQRWAVALFTRGESRLGFARDLRHGRQVCLLESRLQW